MDTQVKDIEELKVPEKKVRKSRFVKGSQESKDYMAMLRSKRKPKEVKED